MSPNQKQNVFPEAEISSMRAQRRDEGGKKKNEINDEIVNNNNAIIKYRN